MTETAFIAISLLHLMVVSGLLGWTLRRFRKSAPVVYKLAWMAWLMSVSCGIAVIALMTGVRWIRGVGALALSIPVWRLLLWFWGKINGSGFSWRRWIRRVWQTGDNVRKPRRQG